MLGDQLIRFVFRLVIMAVIPDQKMKEWKKRSVGKEGEEFELDSGFREQCHISNFQPDNRAFHLAIVNYTCSDLHWWYVCAPAMPASFVLAL
jgi:hypothetical protein